MLERLKAQRAALKAKLEALTETAATEQRNLTDTEDTEWSEGVKELRKYDERIDELQQAEVREARSAAHHVEIGNAGEHRTTGNAKVTDAPVYVKDGSTGHSYFRDLSAMSQGGEVAREATDRLSRNAKAAAETRALGNTNTTGGSGGEFAPPTWLVDEWINLLRPGRVTADLFRRGPVPANTSSISIPKVLTGTAVAIQTTQNSTLAQTDLTTGFVSTGFMTIGGKQVVSQQLLDQSAVPLDSVISADLAAAYNAYFGQQVWLGTGTGANNNAVLNGLMNAPVLAANQATLTATTTTAFYSKANGMLASFVANRFAPPEVWIMHPRRWYWLLAQVDTQGRPLVVPGDVAVNPIATAEGTPVQGASGRFLGLPVVLDPNVPTNLGAGTNQDTIFLLRTSDLWLFESPYQAESFRQPYAESLGVLFRLFNYAGAILNRLSSSIATLNGAGLVAPTF